VFIEGFRDDRSEFETIADHVQIGCLSALEGREYLGAAEPYSNSECFGLYARQYREGAAAASPIFRRDSTPMGLAGAALRVHMPVQTVPVPRISLNEPLYQSLADLRRRLLEEERVEDWAVWAESIGPNPSIPSILRIPTARALVPTWNGCSCPQPLSAFLGACPSAPDVAEKVVAALIPQETRDRALEVVHDWAKEFYRLRNDFAHGKMRSRQPRTWNSASHLLLGAVAFPLLVKRLLERQGTYRPTENDRREVAAFARFAADLRNPASQLKAWHQYVRD